MLIWQRRRDSNPRNALTFTPLAGERLRPLGHVSAAAYTATLGPFTRVFFFKPPFFVLWIVTLPCAAQRSYFGLR